MGRTRGTNGRGKFNEESGFAQSGALRRHLKHFLDENSICAVFQSAYRPRHSAETALLRIHNDVAQPIDARQDVFLVRLAYLTTLFCCDACTVMVSVATHMLRWRPTCRAEPPWCASRKKSRRTVSSSMYKWNQDWQLLFNFTKCKCLHIGYNNPNYDYCMADERMESVDMEKDIGVHIHKSLKVKEQQNYVVKKANKILGTIRRNYIDNIMKNIKN